MADCVVRLNNSENIKIGANKRKMLQTTQWLIDYQNVKKALRKLHSFSDIFAKIIVYGFCKSQM